MENLSKFLHRYYPRVNTRITAPFLLMTVVVAGLGVFIVTQLVSSSIAERLNNQLLSSAQAATNAMVEIESEQLTALRALVFTDGIPQAISNNDVEIVAERLAPIVLNNQLDSVIVFDSAATPIYNIGYEPFTANLISNPVSDTVDIPGIYRVLQIETDEQGDKFVDIVEVNGESVFYITAPVVNDENFIVGAIAVGFRANNVLRRLTEQALAGLIIYDVDGNIITTSLRANDEALTLSDDARMALWNEVQTASPFRELNINDIPYRTLYNSFEVRSRQVGVLAVALPADFVIEDISVSRNAFIVLFGTLFFVVIVIGVIVTRSITSPINKLVDTTRAIQEGDLSRRVGLNQPDEIGELSLSFDNMAERLVARNQEVEDLYAQQIEETARREAILSSISDAVIVRGQNGNVVMMNPAAQNLLNELEAYPESFSEFMELQWQPERLTEPRSLSVEDRHFSVLATPVYAGDRRAPGHIIVYRDISRLVEAEKLKDEMILQLSHELRTPLTSVRGYVELLKLMNATSLDKQSQSFINKAMDQLIILERMVNQVIDVSAYLAEEIELEIEIFDLAAVLDEVLAAHQETIRGRFQRLSVYRPPTPVRIDGDPIQLRDVIDHILRNAISYTTEGGHISVTLDYVDSQFVEVVIIDNGAGIAPDELDRVFDRLYRGRSADAGETDTRGLGLGLFMSREVVDAHNGRITIDSEQGKGTIVTVLLPIKQESVE